MAKLKDGGFLGRSLEACSFPPRRVGLSAYAPRTVEVSIVHLA